MTPVTRYEFTKHILELSLLNPDTTMKKALPPFEQNPTDAEFQKLCDLVTPWIKMHLHKLYHNELTQEDREDLLQEVLIKIARALRGELGQRVFFDNEAGLRAWVNRITKNTFLEWVRFKESRIQQDTLTPSDSGDHVAELDNPQFQSHVPSPMDAVELKELENVIQIGIAKMPKRQKKAWEIFYYKNSYQTIAQSLNISEGATKALIYRGRAFLLIELLNYYDRQSLEKIFTPFFPAPIIESTKTLSLILSQRWKPMNAPLIINPLLETIHRAKKNGTLSDLGLAAEDFEQDGEEADNAALNKIYKELIRKCKQHLISIFIKKGDPSAPNLLRILS